MKYLCRVYKIFCLKSITSDTNTMTGTCKFLSSWNENMVFLVTISISPCKHKNWIQKSQGLNNESAKKHFTFLTQVQLMIFFLDLGDVLLLKVIVMSLFCDLQTENMTSWLSWIVWKIASCIWKEDNSVFTLFHCKSSHPRATFMLIIKV